VRDGGKARGRFSGASGKRGGKMLNRKPTEACHWISLKEGRKMGERHRPCQPNEREVEGVRETEGKTTK